MPKFRYAFTDLSLIPDQIIRTKDSLGALRSIYLAFKYAFDEISLRKNFRDIFIFVGNSGNPYLDTLLSDMLFSYVQKRASWDPPILLEMIETLPEPSKEVVMSTYDKIIAQGKKLGMKEGIEQGIERGIEQGIEQGMEQKARQFVLNLVRSTDWDDEKIALISGISVEKVREIRTASTQS